MPVVGAKFALLRFSLPKNIRSLPCSSSIPQNLWGFVGTLKHLCFVGTLQCLTAPINRDFVGALR